MKLALEALEKLNNTKSYWWQEVDEDVAVQLLNAETALRESLAQPQQEIVAWFYRDNLGRPCSTTKRPLNPLKDMQPLYFVQEFVCSTGLCHYRKPLTDEQIETVWRSVQANDFHDCVKPFARAIEAKHNIKGDAC